MCVTSEFLFLWISILVPSATSVSVVRPARPFALSSSIPVPSPSPWECDLHAPLTSTLESSSLVQVGAAYLRKMDKERRGQQESLSDSESSFDDAASMSSAPSSAGGKSISALARARDDAASTGTTASGASVDSTASPVDAADYQIGNSLTGKLTEAQISKRQEQSARCAVSAAQSQENWNTVAVVVEHNARALARKETAKRERLEREARITDRMQRKARELREAKCGAVRKLSKFEQRRLKNLGGIDCRKVVDPFSIIGLSFKNEDLTSEDLTHLEKSLKDFFRPALSEARELDEAATAAEAAAADSTALSLESEQGAQELRKKTFELIELVCDYLRGEGQWSPRGRLLEGDAFAVIKDDPECVGGVRRTDVLDNDERYLQINGYLNRLNAERLAREKSEANADKERHESNLQRRQAELDDRQKLLHGQSKAQGQAAEVEQGSGSGSRFS